MTIRRLQLVVPDAIAQLHLFSQQADQCSELIALQSLLTLGQRSRLWIDEDLYHARLDSWQQSFLCALPTDIQDSGVASARLSWLGEGGVYQHGSFFYAMPLYFQAGLDDVHWRMPPPFDNVEAEGVYSDLQPLVSSAGFQLFKSPEEANTNWYLWSDKELTINTFSLLNVSQSRLRDLMPQGVDAREMRRLMTEVQMLLHEHPVNKKRENNGILPINALWFYGHAPLRSLSNTIDAVIMSDSAYVKGLCQFLNIPCFPPPLDVQSLLRLDAEKLVLVLPQNTLSSIERHWLKDLYPALLRGQLSKMDIHLDNWQVTLRGGRWAQLSRQIHRKRHSIQEYLP